ncbi:MAG: DUF4160 domain-containing protein [Pseudomonadota bacterium]
MWVAKNLRFQCHTRNQATYFQGAYSGEHQAIIGIDDGTVLEGNLPKSKMKLVQAWIEIHRENLMANWRLAVEGHQPFKIEPLR